MPRVAIPVPAAALALGGASAARAQSPAPGAVVTSRAAVPVQGQITASSDSVH